MLQKELELEHLGGNVLLGAKTTIRKRHNPKKPYKIRVSGKKSLRRTEVFET